MKPAEVDRTFPGFHMGMLRKLNVAGLVAVMLLSSSSAFADLVQFGKGSLIIPNQANFQTPCGSLASYGLVLRILKANQPGGYFDTQTHPTRTPVTVYWAVGNNKKSPNRCIPTNLNSAPSSSGSTDPNSFPSWNDGCDFTVDNSGAKDQPVTIVDYSQDPWANN
jgi:type IV pilus assembly protein PilY1